MNDNVVQMKKPNGKLVWKIVVATVIVITVLILGSSAFYVVSEGYVAAVYTLNKLDTIEKTAGLHFKIPFMQSVSLIDIREQSIQIEQNAYTRDTQTVQSLLVKVNYRLNSSKLEQIIQETGVDDVFQKIIEPNVLSVTKNLIGQYAADALIEHRSEIAQSIQDLLTKIYDEKGVTLCAFTIQNIDFEDSFEEAVRRKVEAEQKALQAQNQTREKEELAKQQVIQAQAEADAVRAKADAEAYAIEIINKQLAGSPDYLQYLYISQWDGRMPMVQGGEATPILDLREYSSYNASSTPSATPTPAQSYTETTGGVTNEEE